MEDMLGQLQGFSISGEDDILGVDDRLVSEGKHDVQFGLAGRRLARKRFRYDVFHELFRSLWQSKDQMDIRQISSDTFLFNFRSDEDRKRVLRQEPWHFDKSLLMLKESVDGENPEEGEFCFT